MKHRLVYGTTQVFCLACPAIYRYTDEVISDIQGRNRLESSECPTSEEEYQQKIKRLKESVK